MGLEEDLCHLHVKVSGEVITSSLGKRGLTSSDRGRRATSSVNGILAEFGGLRCTASLAPTSMSLLQVSGSLSLPVDVQNVI